jgi:hypothetical protein
MLSLVDLHSSWSSPGLVPLSGSRGARHHPQTQSGRTRSTHPHPSRFQPGVICVEEVPPSEGFPHHPSVRALTKVCGLCLLNSIYFGTADYGVRVRYADCVLREKTPGSSFSLSAPLLLLLTKMGEGLDQPSPIPKK